LWHALRKYRSDNKCLWFEDIRHYYLESENSWKIIISLDSIEKFVGRLAGIKKISIADGFTVVGALFGGLAIYFLLTGGGSITLGTAFILLALIMDGCDGAAARKFGTKHDYGRHIDSIADGLSFCLAPAVLIYTVFFNGNALTIQGGLAIVVMVLVTILGWTRLYKFSIEGYKLKNFSGLPTPANAFLGVMVAHILGGHWYIGLPILLVGAILQVAPIPYPKVRGKVAIVLALAIAISFLVMLVPRVTGTSSETYMTYQVITFLALLIALAYVLGGPIYEKKGKRSHGA
jgi:CDP-diacylglycerol--serine O-phosphatidyltransferase